jgi:hypothetical protein
MRCRPQRNDPNWRQCWQWASNIKCNSLCYVYRKAKWPDAREIASQYVFLGILEMRESFQLSLHRKAKQLMPQSVVQRVNDLAARLAGMGQLSVQISTAAAIELFSLEENHAPEFESIRGEL